MGRDRSDAPKRKTEKTGLREQRKWWKNKTEEKVGSWNRFSQGSPRKSCRWEKLLPERQDRPSRPEKASCKEIPVGYVNAAYAGRPGGWLSLQQEKTRGEEVWLKMGGGRL